MSEEAQKGPLTLGRTNVGRPQLQHTNSQQSITASEDYQSANSGSRPGTAGSIDSQLAPVSRMSALSSHPHQHEGQPLHPISEPGRESFLPQTQDTFDRLQGTTVGTRPRAESSQIRRKPVPNTVFPVSPTHSNSSDSNGKISETVPDIRAPRRTGTADSSPTPADDTPYIRFALDQLTRDEEVRGSRAYPTQDRWSTAPRAAYGAYSAPTRSLGTDRLTQPNQRNIDAAGYAPPEYGSAPSYATAPPTNGHSMPAQTSYPIRTSSTSQTGPSHSYAAPAAAASATAATAPMIARRFSSRSSDDIEADHGYVTPEEEPPTRIATARPIQPTIRTHTPKHSQSAEPMSNSVFVPFDQEVPPLRFLPAILRPLWLGLYVFLLLLVLAALIFSGVFSGLKNGLFGYTQFGGGRYFIFQYLPLLISMILLLWQFQIQIAVQRIAPFIAMASNNSKSRSDGPLMEYQPTNFLFPKVFYFRAGQPIIGVAMIIFWLQIFDLPLIAALYNVYYYGAAGAGNWRWLTTQAICWVLVAFYFLLIVALVVLGAWLWRQRTGLRWDPRSLADIVALLDRSNVYHDYTGTETFLGHQDFYQRLGLRSDRLGYWTTSSRPENAFYGIGEEGGPTKRYSMQRGQLQEKPLDYSRSPDTPLTPIEPNLEDEDEHHRIRYRYLPWYLKTTWALLWVVAGILLYLAFLVASFVNNATIRGFKPLLPVAPDADGFSTTNFLYSFIPAVIAQLLFLCWLSVDYAFRRLQPFAGLAASKRDYIGGSAQQTLFLDYTSRLPGSVTIAALSHRNYRVAWYSFLTLIAACLPVLAGGCFWAQFYIPTQQVRVAVHPPAFYALCVFLAIFAVTLSTILFGMRKRKLPHACTTLAEQISWLYASNILGEREWRAPLGSKTEMASRLLTANTPQERELAGGHFYFGRFVGRDGRTHMGIDRIGRDARPEKGRRRWRQQDPSGSLTTPPSAEKTGRYTRESVDYSRGEQSEITRSTSGRFVPVAATAGVGAGAAGLATVYDNDNEKAYEYHNDREDLMPRQPAAAMTAPQRMQDGSYATERPSRLSESDKPALAREREARRSANYPSGSSAYPSYTVGTQSASQSAAVNPFADPVSPIEDNEITVRRTNTDPKWYESPYLARENRAEDSMADLAEADKPAHVRARARGPGSGQ